jgi:4-hydroxybenzoate polyprenyltransferase
MNLMLLVRKFAVSSVRNISNVVAFPHTIFALPFALAMAVVVARSYPVSLRQIVFIVLALVTARTAAMGFNRILDRRIDALNTRTKGREIPAGVMSVSSVAALVVMSALVFFHSSYCLGWHCLLLSPVVLGWLLFYSYTKRFTSGAHFVLGVALALAPGGVWFALTGIYSWQPVWMMVGVLCWVAGFDIMYSCQDLIFDRQQGLHSVPVFWENQRRFC